MKWLQGIQGRNGPSGKRRNDARGDQVGAIPGGNMEKRSEAKAELTQVGMGAPGRMGGSFSGGSRFNGLRGALAERMGLYCSLGDIGFSIARRAC